MKLGDFGIAGSVTRLVGCLAFVVVTTPLGPKIEASENLVRFEMPLGVTLFAGAIALCMHYYLLARSYYVLKASGVFIFFVIYSLFAINVLMFVSYTITILEQFKFFLLGFLTLFYSFGLIFNHIDTRLSGLLHAKNIP
jgi:hypothetical protein